MEARGVEGGGIVGWLHASKSLSASIGRNHVPSHPPAPSFSYCLPLIYRWPTEFYSPMRMILFPHDYFVAIVKVIGPQGGTSGFVGAQRAKAT